MLGIIRKELEDISNILFQLHGNVLQLLHFIQF